MAEETEDAPEVKRGVHWFLIIIGLIMLVAGGFQLPPNLREQFRMQGLGDWEARNAFSLVRAVQVMVVGAFAITAGVGLDSRRAWAWGMGVMILALVVISVATELATSLGSMGYYGEGDYLVKPLIVIAGGICLAALGNLVRGKGAYTA